MASVSVPPMMDDDTIAFGGEEDNANGRLKHPYVTFFHLAFRGAAIFIYMFATWFSDSFIAGFVIIILLLSMDFWTVKNITGRLMVGLRWWNYIDDNGQSHWVFESRKGSDQNRVNQSEAQIFWMSLIICPLIWGLFFIVALFSRQFKWLLLISIASILNGANLYGYIKCKMGKDKNISAATGDFLKKQVMQNMMGSMMSNTQSPTAQPTRVV